MSVSLECEPNLDVLELLNLDDEGEQLDLSMLTEAELEHVNSVVERDHLLQMTDERRVKLLETNFTGTLDKRSKRKDQLQIPDDDLSVCSCCFETFSMLFNPKSVCKKCENFICRKCSVQLEKQSTCVCKLCDLAIGFMTKSGRWVQHFEDVQKPIRRSGSVLVGASIRRLRKNYSDDKASSLKATSSSTGETHIQQNGHDTHNGHSKSPLPEPQKLAKYSSAGGVSPRQSHSPEPKPAPRATNKDPPSPPSKIFSSHNDATSNQSNKDSVIPPVNAQASVSFDNSPPTAMLDENHDDMDYTDSVAISPNGQEAEKATVSVSPKSNLKHSVNIPDHHVTEIHESEDSPKPRQIPAKRSQPSSSRHVTIGSVVELDEDSQNDFDPKSSSMRRSPRQVIDEKSAKTPTVQNKYDPAPEPFDPTKLPDHYDSDDNTIDEELSNQLGIQRFSNSMSALSVYSETEESYEHTIPASGEIGFGLHYDKNKFTFYIYIVEGRSLPICDERRKTSDIYIKTYLLPDKTSLSKRKTTVKQGTINPVFIETVEYFIPLAELRTRTLSVAVWHRRRIGHNLFLGDVHVDMKDFIGEPIPTTFYNIENTPKLSTSLSLSQASLALDKGDIALALRYDSSKAHLQIQVKKARGLVLSSSRMRPDAFAKLVLLPDRSQKGKRKTQIIRKSNDPEWNVTFHFAVPKISQLTDSSLEITVWHYGRFKSNAFLGGLRLNTGVGKLSSGEAANWMLSKGNATTMWQTMLKASDEWVEATLKLRANMN